MLARISIVLWWFGAIVIVAAGYVWLSGEALRQDCVTALQAGGKSDAAYKLPPVDSITDKNGGKGIAGDWSAATRISTANPAAREPDRTIDVCKRASAGLHPLDFGLVLGVILWAIAFVLDGALLPNSRSID